MIKQAIYLPVIYFGSLIIASLFAQDYSHLGQHASELGINSSETAVKIFSIGIFLTGVSLILYGLGVWLKFKKELFITGLLIFLFGISFVFGTFYKIGSPWHGLYGVGLSVMLLPFVFLYEVGKGNLNRLTRTFSITAALVFFVYFWAMIARLDPMDQRGLTQRIFGVFVFGFMSYSAYKLKNIKNL